MWWPLRLLLRLLPAVRVIVEIIGVVVYTSTGVDSCSAQQFARSRSRQSSPLKLLVCHSFAHLLGNAHQLLRQELLSRFDIIGTSCVALRILEHLLDCTVSSSLRFPCTASNSNSPSSVTLCPRRCDELVLHTSHHSFDSLGIRVLLVADVGQLDDNLSINLVVPHHHTVHLVQLLVGHSLHGSPPAVPLLVVRCLRHLPSLPAPQHAPSRSS